MVSAPYQPQQGYPQQGHPPQGPQSFAPGWYPDPFGRHESRYYDGRQWTEHVSNYGTTAIDPPVGQSYVPVDNRDRSRIVGDMTRAGVAAGQGAGTGSLLTEPVLVVNQKPKLIEVHSEYAIYDQNAVQIGAIREVGQSATKKAMRMLTSFDQFMTHKLQIVDMAGSVHMQVTRPAKFMKSRVILQDGYGQEIGDIVQQNVFGKIRFAIEMGGQTVGSINAENWRAWDFNLRDAYDREIGRVTKTWSGFARAAFTTADNYVVQIDPSVTGSLRAVAIAAALAIDTALKQDDRGVSIF